MREIASPLSGPFTTFGQTPIDIYKVGAYRPELAYSFYNEYYRRGRQPVNFLDAITHTRNGNATMTDSSGNIVWAPHNLLTYSEDFSNAAWAKTNTTVTANAAVAPDGTQTADLLEFDTGAGTDRLTSNGVSVATGFSHTFGIWLKGTAGETVTIEADVQAVEATLTGEWQYETVTDPTYGSTTALVRIIKRASTASEVYIWGAHLYRSDLGGMADVPADERVLPTATKYVSTTDAARYLPRVNHHAYNGSQWVNKGLFVESEARTNLVAYSDFSSNWTAGGTTLTANNAAGLDGNTSAATLVEDGSAGQHKLQSSVTVSSGVTYTWSLVVKANGRSAFSLYPQSGTAASARFDLDAAVSTDDVTTNLNGHGIHLIAPDKYLCWITFTTTGTTVLPHIYLRDSAAATSAPSYTGDGVSGLIIEATQLEAGSTPSSYLPTNGASVTRPAESITIPAANLPWPNPVYVTGEELVTNGTFDTDTSGWTASGGTLAVNNQRLEVTSGGSGNGYGYQAISCDVGGVYRVSLDLTLGTGSNALLWVGTSAGGGQTKQEAFIADGSYTTTFVATSVTHYIRVGANEPTASLTYLFDNISVKEINPLALSIQMSGEMTYADEGQTQDGLLFKWSIDSSNRIYWAVSGLSTFSGRFTPAQVDGGTYDFSNGVSGDIEEGVQAPFNFASRHGSTFIQGAVNGVALTANTTPTALPDLENTDLELGYNFMGTISLFRIWANDLGDTGIEEATEPSTQATLFLSFDGSNNSYIDFEWSV